MSADSRPLVVFRMDDIQDNWLENIQQTVINVFQSRGLPLTIGIIGNYFGRSNLKNFVKGALQNKNFPLEIANHGYNHEDFTQFSLTQQKTLLQQAKSQTISALSPFISNIKSFIPPFNKFNADTSHSIQFNSNKINFTF